MRSYDLPDEIEAPRTTVQIDWMVDFVNENTISPRFVKDAQRALNCRHPFGAFKNVMADYGLLDIWYEYRDSRCQDYVREELDLD